MGAKLNLQCINIERHIYLLRQLLDHLAAEISPTLALETLCCNPLGEEQLHLVVGGERIQLRLIYIANSNLDQARYRRNLLDDISCNCTMRIGKGFTLLSIIGMSVDKEYAKIILTLGHSLHSTKRHRMVATDNGYGLTLRHPMLGLLVDTLVHLGEALIDMLNLACSILYARCSTIE